MRISNPFVIGFFITLFIVLNIFIIPRQRKVQREIDKKAIWTIKSDEAILDMLVTPYCLVQLVDTEPIFQLKSFNKATGEAMELINFSTEIGAAEKVVYTNDVIYLVFANGNIYQLDAQTLLTNWKVNIDLKIYDYQSISVEQTRDLLLVATKNTYNSFYFFLETTTGNSVYNTHRTSDAIQPESLPVFFDSKEQESWGTYYNFKEHHLIFNKKASTYFYSINEYIVDLNDSLELSSFDLEQLGYQKTYERYTANAPFFPRQIKLDLDINILEYYNKEITDTQFGSKSTVFRFEEINPQYYRSIPTVDYSFLKNGAQSTSLSLNNIHKNAIKYTSNDYFITLRGDHPDYNQSHSELVIVDLSDLSFKAPLYIPIEQIVVKVLCDKEQIYLFLKKEENNKVYCSALPISS